MKKMLLVLGMCFVTLGLIAQEGSKLLEDQLVEPPKFEGKNIENRKAEVSRAPICFYMEENLQYPERRYDFPPEGTVVIEFTVNADATVSNFVVVNHIDNELDQAVIDCIKKTDGMWIPGKVNGQPSVMEKRVSVKFAVPGNPTFEEQAKELYFSAIRKFTYGEYIKSNNLLSAEQKAKRSNRKFKNSLALLDKASAFYPNDKSLLWWQAKNHKMLGNQEEMRNKLNEIARLQHIENNLELLVNEYELAVIYK
ncbi:TonB family protein [Labilibacter sediminis]|nr:TonB family protein [Labilibacter sediminis]